MHHIIYNIMKKQTFITLALLAIAGRATAQNTISCPDITAQGGQQVELPIALTSDEELTVVGISFTLTLPEGATFKKKTNGKPVYALVESRLDPEDFSVTPEFYSDNSLGVRIYTTSSTAVLQGTEGTVMTFTLDIDESMEAGEHDISLTENKLSIKNSGNTVTSLVIDNYKSKLTITEAGDSRILLDENSTTAPESATNVDVRVKRTINANEWSTIVLPFAMTEEQVKETFGPDVMLADFSGTDSEYDVDDNCVGVTLNFNAVTAIEANHPYIIKVSTAVTEFTVDGVTVDPDEEASVDRDELRLGSGKPKDPYRYLYNSFVGTYVAQTVLPSMTLFLYNNKFYYSTGKTKMKAFRAYFDFYDVLTDVENANSIKVWVNPDDATGIKAISDSPLKGEDTYNLAGQRVGENYKGIVVKKGKKVLKIKRYEKKIYRTHPNRMQSCL